jgi:hypothetical protein
LIDVATAETPTKRRGRPAKPKLEAPAIDPNATFDEDSTPEPETDKEITPFPPIDQNVSPQKLFDYWNNTLTKAQRRYGNVYVYRQHPRMRLEMQRGRPVNPYCEKFSDEDGPLSADVIFARRRIGIYLLRLNQKVLKPHGTIAFAELELRGKGDWNEEEMPILEIEKVDIEYPSNKDYVRVLRSRGILKAGEEDEDMAGNEVLGEVIKDLSQGLRDNAKANNAPTQQNDTASAAVGVRALEILERKMEREAPAGQQGTLVDTLNSLGGFIKATAPATPDFAPFLASIEKTNQMVLDLKEQEVKRAMIEAQRLREEAMSIRAAIPAVKTVDEQWDELERSAKRFQRMTGKQDREKPEDAEDDEEKNPTSAAGFLGMLAGALPAIRGILHEVNIGLYNYKLNGSGAPPLNPATGQPGTEPLAPTEQDEDDGPPLSPADQAKMEHMQNVVNQLSALAQPMLSHLMRNKTGGEFAKFTIDNYGPQAFELVRGVEGGRDTIMAMIQQYPPVWNQIGPARLPQFTKFLDEFMMYSGVPVQ